MIPFTETGTKVLPWFSASEDTVEGGEPRGAILVTFCDAVSHLQRILVASV